MTLPGPLLSVAPDPARAEAVDAQLRLRLAESLDYLASLTSGDRARRVTALKPKLEAGPVSPWVFSLYSQLVVEMAKSGDRSAAIIDALDEAIDYPAATEPMALHDGSVPEDWWEHYHTLLDTDPLRNFRPIAPSQEEFGSTAETIAEALDLMRRCDTQVYEETRCLLRVPILAAPSSDEADARFNGASTFFFWGGSLLSAAYKRNVLAMVDVLVHEASHLLLFGLVEGQALTHNDATERYESALRTDPRPIDGIFHACFVSTRVEAVMQRLLASGRLSAEETELAMSQMERNGSAARSCLASLDQFARPTERGAAIIDVLRNQLGREPATAPA